MTDSFLHLKDIFNRTKEAIVDFMGILEPAIKNAKDEHERLYFHHIYEEEEHRSDRLQELLPKLDTFIEYPTNQHMGNPEFIHVLQDISLEKFGLHNFLEHLDLALFQFKDTEHINRLQQLRDMTFEDYQETKRILQELNEQFDGAASKGGSVPMDEKEDVKEALKIEMYTDGAASANHQSSIHAQTHFIKKGLTVGSLKK
ncbi:IMEF encapsulin system ferritin-like cargo protein [Thermoflavimicrobium dichotomicum]|uniref:Encapsulated protein n=1 Tax=Thermoflavimicrobium dichotomicum TaxID=46223 RepID=A0A1I3S4U2_9BACL|nr:IMEF encapsulin system ferritin-like cargo protein [Thermoflavimicrobium dichotomicum]SFJ53695.1 encapsulated protein [Thermoflavimicrobium dichotomicum]